jgi:hypothetical protein
MDGAFISNLTVSVCRNRVKHGSEREMVQPFVAATGAMESQEKYQPIRAEFGLKYFKHIPTNFFVRHVFRSEAFAKYNSTRSVVQVATLQPKKSVSSVQIGQPSARAAARTGQSSSSRLSMRSRATASKEA